MKTESKTGLAIGKVMAVAAMAGVLVSPALLRAQEARSGDAAPAPHISNPACPEIVGKHLLLEKMTAAFDLTCEQEIKIEPLLHDEESVSKPLLAYAAFTQEEKTAMMLKVKLAARAQIRPLLTPEQQKKSDAEAASVAAAAEGAHKGGGGKGGKPAPKPVDPFVGEEALSDAISKYSAFSPEQKKALMLEVKKAARREGAPELTAEQAAKIDADIKRLS